MYVSISTIAAPSRAVNIVAVSNHPNGKQSSNPRAEYSVVADVEIRTPGMTPDLGRERGVRNLDVNPELKKYVWKADVEGLRSW